MTADEKLPCYDTVLFGVGYLICSLRPSKRCVALRRLAVRAHRSDREESEGEKANGGGEESRAVSIVERRVHLLLLEARAASAAGGGREGGGEHAWEVFSFLGKDASLILSKEAEEDPIATGEKRSFGRIRSGGYVTCFGEWVSLLWPSAALFEDHRYRT
ncbi:hypothetical protein NQZ68_009160 [Dissostichus eleginoides]|nr:hypothetical protein NQZ68_009160 [Dissostichus eleginoides]